MSASESSVSVEAKLDTSDSSEIISRYALYLFSNNKHVSVSDENCGTKDNLSTSKDDNKSSDLDEPTFCLSLLEGNLVADLETVVRCYLLKSLSAQEDLILDNEGKYIVLQSNDDSDETFGCYYHRLSKCPDGSNQDKPSQDEKPSKVHTFFICLIGPCNGIMESFCSELGTFCCSLLSLLDPESQKNQEHVQLKLRSWYYYCVEYISRCIKKFKEELAQALHCSLWGNVKIISTDEETLWDLERLVETCSLMPKCTNSDNEDFPSSENVTLPLEVKDEKFILDKKLDTSPYCMRWYDKLKNCSVTDHAALHNILEGFRLKAIQDLNTLKRLVQKAETDYYALFRAYHFLQASGYENLLLFHVKREANMAAEMGTIEVITCLQEFMASNTLS